jgi:hypothetical protein
VLRIETEVLNFRAKNVTGIDVVLFMHGDYLSRSIYPKGHKLGGKNFGLPLVEILSGTHPGVTVAGKKSETGTGNFCTTSSA